jgi:hypothetical protein
MNRALLVLLVAAGFYCYASGAEVLLVKLMNTKPVSVLLPLGTALLGMNPNVTLEQQLLNMTGNMVYKVVGLHTAK